MFSLQFTAAAFDNAKMQVLLPHCSPANLEEALPGEVCWRLGSEYGDASRGQPTNQPTNQPANQPTNQQEQEHLLTNQNDSDQLEGFRLN